MTRSSPSVDLRIRAVVEALKPYAWHGLTAEMISRRALAAIDGCSEGRPTGPPVPRHDDRILILLACLHGHAWRSLTVEALSRQLVTALDSWHHESQWLEVELRWLLDTDG
ncbi:hypothetical protein [Streptomyces chromofuscus]|uniref:Transposase n=1 Tax=Streptomyces chromofuscus TaxID=42881 RepID=A0A7M2T9L7_STRCW|nr:hypothetical protein [Streptomyces chromofuscus]QOV44613.1 hypothetical protein IPT68_00770 [Streptomyces chromofuscus]GGT01854.1 hypothetical protein GCM10010254_22730 [Streptomyces chromofuscus]